MISLSPLLLACRWLASRDPDPVGRETNVLKLLAGRTESGKVERVVSAFGLDVVEDDEYDVERQVRDSRHGLWSGQL